MNLESKVLMNIEYAIQATLPLVLYDFEITQKGGYNYSGCFGGGFT
jgi:hypothetical protein